MARTKRLTSYAEGKLTRRLTRAIPYVGGAKNIAEVARGRDFLSDRVRANLNERVS